MRHLRFLLGTFTVLFLTGANAAQVGDYAVYSLTYINVGNTPNRPIENKLVITEIDTIKKVYTIESTVKYSDGSVSVATGSQPMPDPAVGDLASFCSNPNLQASVVKVKTHAGEFEACYGRAMDMGPYDKYEFWMAIDFPNTYKARGTVDHGHGDEIYDVEIQELKVTL